MRSAFIAFAAAAAFMFVVAVVLTPSPARADDVQVAVAQGQNVQQATAPAGSSWSSSPKLLVQCPNIDGGAGQKVYYRPASATDTVDAGPGDYLIDFTLNADGYPVTLRGGKDRINLRSYNAADPLFCPIYSRSP